MEQIQKGPLPLNLDALVDNTPAAELVVTPSVTVVPDQEPAPFIDGLDRLKDYELVDHIQRKKTLLEKSSKNLPDKGAKLRALIKSYEDEVHRRKVNPRPQVQVLLLPMLIQHFYFFKFFFAIDFRNFVNLVII